MQVRLMDRMGSDLTVVNAARGSFAKESEWESIPEGGEIEPMKSSSTDENTEDSDVKPEPRIDLSMLPEPPVTEVVRTPNINPNLFAQAPTGIMQNLTNTERALLSPEEQVIRQRIRT